MEAGELYEKTATEAAEAVAAELGPHVSVVVMIGSDSAGLYRFQWRGPMIATVGLTQLCAAELTQALNKGPG